MSAQTLSALATIAIYAGLIGFVLYRQMRAQPLRGRRLVLLPAVLGLFAFQQLARQPLDGLGTAALLVLSLAVGAAAGLWRGTTFRLWDQQGAVYVKGSRMTLVAWAALIAARLPFAVVSYEAKLPQGLVIGELLLALAVTFAAQNAVVWMRAGRVVHPR